MVNDIISEEINHSHKKQPGQLNQSQIKRIKREESEFCEESENIFQTWNLNALNQHE